jgi:hypothetical protein
VCEILGAIGLILPGLLGVRPSLTPLAAGLVIIMIGATTVTLAGGQVGPALVPAFVGLLSGHDHPGGRDQHRPLIGGGSGCYDWVCVAITNRATSRPRNAFVGA